MYCGNCGSKISDNSQFCPNCGIKIENVKNLDISKSDEIRKKSSVKTKGIVISVIVAVLLILGIAIGNIGGAMSNGYKSVVEKYFKAMETCDGELYYSIMSEDYVEDMIDGWGYTEQELIDTYQEHFEEKMEGYEYDYGDNIQISYEIYDTYDPLENELNVLESELRYYGIQSGSVEEAVVAYIDYTVKGKLGSGKYSTDRLILKIDGKWCITGGSIDLSWYEQ